MPRTSIPVILAALVLAGLPWTAAAQPSAAAHQQAEAIFRQYKLPGFAVAVARDGEIIDSESFGYADLEHGVPVTAATRFRIGSLSKLLTIAAVARLHQEGKLDLDAPIDRYVPYFPEKKWPVTTRQLASHTAGVRHYDPKDFEAILAKLQSYSATWESVEEGLSLFIDDPLVFEPGTQYGYSSYGYNLISAVVEGASGQDFLDYMESRVFTPLGLRSTTADRRQAIIEHRTDFYYVNPETGEVVHDAPVDNSYKWASGGFLSSAEDLVRLGSAFLEPGFFEAETLAAIFTPQPNAENHGYRVGLGWRIDEDPQGRRIYHHGGAIAGGRGFILLYPEARLAVALLANSFARFGEQEAFAVAAPFLDGRPGLSPQDQTE